MQKIFGTSEIEVEDVYCEGGPVSGSPLRYGLYYWVASMSADVKNYNLIEHFIALRYNVS